MNQPASKILSIFADALACTTSESRINLLDRLCADDALLRAQVEALLNAHHEAGDFLKGSETPVAFADGIEETKVETAGMTIGAYRLLEQIGEGGMGVVYMADQLRPVRRRVA